MKYVYITLVMGTMFFQSSFVFSQTVANIEIDEGAVFKMTKEYNVHIRGLYNLEGKTELEKFLLPERNSKVEFFVDPSFSGAYSFRVDMSDSAGGAILKTNRIINWDEVHKKVEEILPISSAEYNNMSRSTEKERRARRKYIKDIMEARTTKAIEEYKTESYTYTISNNLAELLYSTFISFMDNHVGKGVPGISKDGCTATFRCVVKDEVWTFFIKTPEYTEFKELEEICNQIIDDVKKGTLSEEKYSKLLENIAN